MSRNATVKKGITFIYYDSQEKVEQPSNLLAWEESDRHQKKDKQLATDVRS